MHIKVLCHLPTASLSKSINFCPWALHRNAGLRYKHACFEHAFELFV